MVPIFRFRDITIFMSFKNFQKAFYFKHAVVTVKIDQLNDQDVLLFHNSLRNEEDFNDFY
jgi:hypothetical protein